MKKNLFSISAFLVIIVLLLNSSCKKDNTSTPIKNLKPVATNNYLSGLGTHVGFPAGMPYVLPHYIHVIGPIRGGEMYKSNNVDKNKYTGPFPLNLIPKSWVTYGTGTFINLYIKFYNSLPSPTTLTIPGGLIFVDSLDNDSSTGVYQKGFILQDIHVPLPALDTAFIVVQAYCLNHTLAPSSYNAIYFIGPISVNPNLNQIVSIMSTKQPPIGQEYNIQTIVWNVTDYGLNITPTEVQYLNSLP